MRPSLALAALLLSCSSPPAMRIVRGQTGEHAPPVTGTNVRIIRPTIADYRGMKTGFFVVRSEEAWRELWEQGVQRLPAGTDFRRNMVIAAAGRSEILESVRVTKLVDAENTLHLYVQETRRGQNCLGGRTPMSFDVAVADRVDKPLVVHVDVDDSPGCGDAPFASVKCRAQSSTGQTGGQAGGQNDAEMTSALEATPGDLIECHAESARKGSFAIVERTWNLHDAPKGSAAKLSFDASGAHTTFMTDMFGRYAVRYDVVDDAGRRTKADAVVQIPPPKSDNPFVQLAWAGFEPSDDPATFPRVYIVATRTSDATECSSKPDPNGPKPAAWCDVKSQPTVSNMRLGTGGNIGDVPLFVHYRDDRYDGAPYLCVRTFFNGVKTADVCDNVARQAGAMWRPGVLDARTGTLVPLREGRDESADAGVPATEDAGSKAVKTGKRPAPKR